MTDPNLAEQAEREIQVELGFRIEDSGLNSMMPKLWQALVRDRCSLLKLRKAAKEVIAASFAGSSEPWDKSIVALRSALEGK